MYTYTFVYVLASDISLSLSVCFYSILFCLFVYLHVFFLKRDRKTKKVWDFIIREVERM